MHVMHYNTIIMHIICPNTLLRQIPTVMLGSMAKERARERCDILARLRSTKSPMGLSASLDLGACLWKVVPQFSGSYLKIRHHIASQNKRMTCVQVMDLGNLLKV